MEAILTAITTVTTLMGNVFDVMTGNAYLTVLLAASLVGVGIGIFRSIRRASRG